MSSSDSSISDFYKNKNLFITGATGFIGKALIEKLLRSCYDLNKIYLLVRSKKGHSPKERLDELVNCKVRNFYLQ
jgi:thioester reductase-like protein